MLLRKRVQIHTIDPQMLVLHPGRTHTVLLTGNFSSLLQTMRSVNGLVWARFADGGPNEVFIPEEIGSNYLRLNIRGEGFAVGGERQIEIGDIPADINKPRLLTTSQMSL